MTDEPAREGLRDPIAGLPDRETLRSLVERYDRPGPRYTSYPTAPVWSEDFGEHDFREELAGSAAGPLSVYVHVPFCERLCSFCACNRTITQDRGVVAPYLEALEREADGLAGALPGARRAEQLAIGGGSPNFLTPPELARLVEIIDTHFSPGSGAERSIELDPRRTSEEHVAVLLEHGFTRLSFGVQDTDSTVQQAINRIQPGERLTRLVELARKGGIASINFDLIYGLPRQSPRSFDGTLDRVIELLPDRIALYSYAHVTWISKAQRGFEKKDLPGAKEKLEIFLGALERLLKAGYRYLGLDHFALASDELAVAAERGVLRRNFMGYTLEPGLDLIALGPSGIAELANAYAQSARDPDSWAAALSAGRLPTLRGWRLSEDDHRRKWLIHEIMCRGVIDPQAYVERFGEALDARVPDLGARIDPLVVDGLLIGCDGGWQVTPVGRLFLRVIAMAFDAYLPETTHPDRPAFSRTV